MSNKTECSVSEIPDSEIPALRFASVIPQADEYRGCFDVLVPPSFGDYGGYLPTSAPTLKLLIVPVHRARVTFWHIHVTDHGAVKIDPEELRKFETRCSTRTPLLFVSDVGSLKCPRTDGLRYSVSVENHDFKVSIHMGFRDAKTNTSNKPTVHIEVLNRITRLAREYDVADLLNAVATRMDSETDVNLLSMQHRQIESLLHAARSRCATAARAMMHNYQMQQQQQSQQQQQPQQQQQQQQQQPLHVSSQELGGSTSSSSFGTLTDFSLSSTAPRESRLRAQAEVTMVRRLKAFYDALSQSYKSCKSTLPHLIALEQAIDRCTETITDVGKIHVTQELVHRSYKRRRFRFDGAMKAATCIQQILAIQSDSPAQTAVELLKNSEQITESLQNAKSLFDAEVALVREGVNIKRIWVIPKAEFMDDQKKFALETVAREMSCNGILIRFVVPEDLDTEDNECLKDTMIIDNAFCQRLELNERFKFEKDYKMDAKWYFDSSEVGKYTEMFWRLWRKAIEPNAAQSEETAAVRPSFLLSDIHIPVEFDSFSSDLAHSFSVSAQNGNAFSGLPRNQSTSEFPDFFSFGDLPIGNDASSSSSSSLSSSAAGSLQSGPQHSATPFGRSGTDDFQFDPLQHASASTFNVRQPAPKRFRFDEPSRN
eukprot:ANDGO_05998.mRNA.1 hypothetical protein